MHNNVATARNAICRRPGKTPPRPMLRSRRSAVIAANRATTAWTLAGRPGRFPATPRWETSGSVDESRAAPTANESGTLRTATARRTGLVGRSPGDVAMKRPGLTQVGLAKKFFARYPWFKSELRPRRCRARTPVTRHPAGNEAEPLARCPRKATCASAAYSRACSIPVTGRGDLRCWTIKADENKWVLPRRLPTNTIGGGRRGEAGKVASASNPRSEDPPIPTSQTALRGTRPPTDWPH